MDRTNLDDPSAFYNLDHSAIPGQHTLASRKPTQVQTDSGGWIRGQHQNEQNEAHFRESLASGVFAWLIDYMKRDPETRDRQPAEREHAAYMQFFRIRAGAHDRVRAYIEVNHMSLLAAIMKAELDVAEADEIECETRTYVSVEDLSPDDNSRAWPDKVLEALMDMHKKTTGSGSKSKSHKTVRQPDAPTVEQALRKQMAA